MDKGMLEVKKKLYLQISTSTLQVITCTLQVKNIALLDHLLRHLFPERTHLNDE